MAGTLTNSMSVFGNRPIKSRSHLPDLVVILNPSENLGLIRECTKVNVPTVGIVDSNTDPRLVTYAIPANMEVSVGLFYFIFAAIPERVRSSVCINEHLTDHLRP